MTTVYGIKNCDTIKKARNWLTEHGIEFDFHDYRQQGIDRAWLELVEKELGWEQLLNKRGTTFRQLPDEQKQSLDAGSAIELMLTHPAMIKRPLLSHNGQYTLGFKPDQYQSVFA